MARHSVALVVLCSIMQVLDAGRKSISFSVSTSNSTSGEDTSLGSSRRRCCGHRRRRFGKCTGPYSRRRRFCGCESVAFGEPGSKLEMFSEPLVICTHHSVRCSQNVSTFKGVETEKSSEYQVSTEVSAGVSGMVKGLPVSVSRTLGAQYRSYFRINYHKRSEIVQEFDHVNPGKICYSQVHVIAHNGCGVENTWKGPAMVTEDCPNIDTTKWY